MGSQVKKNYIYNVIYRLSICILPLIVTPYVARVLGAGQVGLYAFSSTVACYFIMFGKLGLDNYGNRSIASCRDDIEKRSKVFWGIYAMQAVTSIISILLFILLIVTVFKADSVVYWMQLMYVCSILFDVSWFFYGMERFRITMIRSLISRTLIIIGVFIFVHSEKDLWIYTCVMSACFLLEQLLLVPYLYRQIKWVSLKKEDITCHIVPNLKLFVPLLALSSYHWMDKIMLGVMTKSTAIVAFYTYAENIINLPKGIMSALDTVMLPRISNLVANERIEEGMRKMRNAIRFNSFVSCALCFGIAGVSPVFIPWFFGEEYVPAIVLTMELAMVMIPMSLAEMVQTQYLIPFKRENIYIRSVTLGAVTDIVLNLLLIPSFGASGAVIGTLCAEVLVCVYQMHYIKDVYRLGQLVKMLLPFMVCGGLEFAVTYFMCGLNINPFLLLPMQILAGGAVYLLGCGIYVIFISKEYRSVKDMIYSLKA
ncbi:O-antigen/teichoic acid export membrane protein [Kineothrix alysoides]|uniref:O-antigen/teichoic acid export membrane protein n=1 Tax=Kineothrix alysoides TaxID=1469948 RepID=A0A4R1QYR2_9FIRM|nr:flippase [Kineothrix alysoides]TCL58099.1 O-antigen/teichoic acid export membrane protein [Kineothrix alysoides]